MDEDPKFRARLLRREHGDKPPDKLWPDGVAAPMDGIIQINELHTGGRMLTSLPKRTTFVRSGDTVGVIYTHDTASSLPRYELGEGASAILTHTRQVYCHPRKEVEQLLVQPSSAQPGPVQPVSQWEEVE